MEEDDLFEITDFTNASPWESFVSSIEEILHQWGLTISTYSPVSGYYPQHRKSEKLSYVGHNFIVTLHVSGEKRKPVPKQTDRDWPDTMVYMMDQSSDFPPTAHHHISRWFGVDQFILIAPDEKSQAITTEAQTKLLLSSISLAANNTGCTLPLFVQVQKSWRHMFVGQCEGCGLRTIFEMIHLKHIPPQFDNLSGLIDLFQSKLYTSSANSPTIDIAARLTYFIRHWNIDDWPVEQFVGSEGSNNSITSLPLGATTDPIQELHLSSMWPHLTMKTITDNSTTSGFDPFSAPTWCITTRLFESPGLLLNERLNSFLKTCYRSDTFTTLLGNKLLQEDMYNPAVGSSDFSHALTKLTNPSPLTSPLSLSSVMYSTNKRLEFGSEFEPISDSDQDIILEFLFPDSTLSSTQLEREDVLEDTLTRQLKSAPPNSLTARLAVSFCNIINDYGLKALAHIWYEVIQELRYRWENGISIPSVGEEHPDTTCCLLHQKLQMLNNCIGHKVSHTAKLHSNPSASTEPKKEFHSPTTSLSFSQRAQRHYEEPGTTLKSTSSESDDEFYEAQESLEQPKTNEASSSTMSLIKDIETDITYIADSPSLAPRELNLEPVNIDPLSLFANEEDELIGISHKEERRIGALHPFKDLTLLVTGEELYVPETQEHTPLTEDMLWEQQSVLSKLGTSEEAAQVRAKMQSSSLTSDMQAFKAANPGCLLEDFIRWYSPRDWIDKEEEETIEHSSDGWELGEAEEKIAKGHLSVRMSQRDNVWVEIWESVTPIPAYKQKRLFDDTKEAEKVLHWLSALKPSELMLMLFPSLIHSTVLTIQKRLESIILPTAWGYLNDTISIAKTVQRVTLDSLPVYQECIGLLERTEHDIATAYSLEVKLKQGLDVIGRTTKSLFDDKELMASIQILIEEPELVLQDPLTSITGSSFHGLLKAQLALQSFDDLSLHHPSYKTIVKTTDNIPRPTVREFILKTVSSQPSVYSTASPQRMFCLLAKDEMRLAGGFTKDILLA